MTKPRFGTLQAIADLADDPNLHVVDHQRERLGPERVRQRLRDVEAVEAIHEQDAIGRADLNHSSALA
jgi:hypothetical protein